MRMQTIEVRALHKARRIVETLKRQGRNCFFEEFADFKGFFYVIFYKPIKAKTN